METTNSKEKYAVWLRQHMQGGVAVKPSNQAPERQRSPYEYKATTQAVATRLNIKGITADDLESTLRFWVPKGPPQYGHDLLHDIAIAWIEERPINGAVAFGMARHIVGRKWRAWHTRQHFSIEAMAHDEPGADLDDMIAVKAQRWTDYLVGALQTDAVAMGNIVATQIWALLPTEWNGYNIRNLVERRLEGENLRKQANILRGWAIQNAEKLIAVTA